MEGQLESPNIRRYEAPLRIPWEIKNQAIWNEVSDYISSLGKYPTQPPTAFRGGDVVVPDNKDLAFSYAAFLANERPFLVMPLTNEPNGKITDVLRYPTKSENIRFDANVAAYRQHLGDYAYRHWDTAHNGPSPIPQTTEISTLPNGMYATTERYRGYLRGIGKGSGALGIHELDTRRISIDELRHIVRVLDAMHPTRDQFYTWIQDNERVIPKESFLHPDHPQHELRNAAWWQERSMELQKKVRYMDKAFRAINPDFDASAKIAQYIELNKNNPAEKIIAHGALYPDNIQLSHDRDGQTSGITIMGGDRSHVGVRGEMADWLIAASAESPAHQKAIIDEFITLHPEDSEKQGLAMHTLYRSIMEASWFAKQKPDAYRNLIQLSYDILNGNGVWHTTSRPS